VLVGRSDEALELANEAKAKWPSGTYHSQRYQYVMFMTQLDLFRSRPWEAFTLIEEEWSSLKAAHFLDLEIVRVELAHLRGRAALAAAASAGASPANGPGGPALLRRAGRAAKIVARSGTAPAGPFAALLRAGIASVQGANASAIDAELARAEEGFKDAKMELYREVVAVVRMARQAPARDPAPQGPITSALPDLAAATAMFAPGRWR
jgi:hypothetical protein